MCDTMVALGNSTASGKVIMAKNSDRQPNEPLLTMRVPRRRHAPGTRLKCTYIEIDQVEDTYEALLLKPSWMWGAEMGANEWGLCIGNEAVFTREKQGPESLLGMDMLRLALERCRSSGQALELLVDLLERHGQGGNCGYEKQFFYHNAFLIADPQEAWVLETAGQYWAAQRVEDVRAISNRLSIGSTFDHGHPDLVRYAKDQRWCRGGNDFDFARCYTNRLVTRFSGSLQRVSACDHALEREKGSITEQTMKRILRSHEPDLEGKQFTRHSLKSVCMHSGSLVGDHTTGSFVATLGGDRHTYLITGASTPCLSLFKPYWLIAGESFSFTEDEEQKALDFWLKREKLHRAVIENRLPDLESYLTERDRLEKDFDRQVALIGDHPAGDDKRLQLMAYALHAEEQLLSKTMEQIEKSGRPPRIGGSLYFRHYWKKQNRELGEGARLFGAGQA